MVDQLMEDLIHETEDGDPLAKAQVLVNKALQLVREGVDDPTNIEKLLHIVVALDVSSLEPSKSEELKNQSQFLQTQTRLGLTSIKRQLEFFLLALTGMTLEAGVTYGMQINRRQLLYATGGTQETEASWILDFLCFRVFDSWPSASKPEFPSGFTEPHPALRRMRTRLYDILAPIDELSILYLRWIFTTCYMDPFPSQEDMILCTADITSLQVVLQAVDLAIELQHTESFLTALGILLELNNGSVRGAEIDEETVLVVTEFIIYLLVKVEKIEWLQYFCANESWKALILAYSILLAKPDIVAHFLQEGVDQDQFFQPEFVRLLAWYAPYGSFLLYMKIAETEELLIQDVSDMKTAVAVLYDLC